MSHIKKLRIKPDNTNGDRKICTEKSVISATYKNRKPQTHLTSNNTENTEISENTKESEV